MDSYLQNLKRLALLGGPEDVTNYIRGLERIVGPIGPLPAPMQDPYFSNAETTIRILGGNELRFPASGACDYVRVCNPGTLVEAQSAYWDSTEWQNEPEQVMGAIIGSLKSDDSDEIYPENEGIYEDEGITWLRFLKGVPDWTHWARWSVPPFERRLLSGHQDVATKYITALERLVNGLDALPGPVTDPLWEPEIVVRTVYGTELRCDGHPSGVSYVRVCAFDGRQYSSCHWTSQEWEEAPEEVMGALLGALMHEVPPWGLDDIGKSNEQAL